MNIIGIQLAWKDASGRCDEEQRFIERDLRELKIDARVSDLSPLFAFKKSSHLEN